MNEKKLDAFCARTFGEKNGFYAGEVIKSLISSVWFMFFTFPLMVIKVNTIDKTIIWRWSYMLYLGLIIFALSFVWRYLLRRQQGGGDSAQVKRFDVAENLARFQGSKFYKPTLAAILALLIVFPFVGSLYQLTVFSTALIYVMLGLGLNIVVGLGGMLNLGYVAFYAVGAYTYALLNVHFGVSFWIALPIGALVSTVAGVIVSFPLLRLRGDYLAIVTLAFAEITRLVLENWGSVTSGPSGIRNIARPAFFTHLKLQGVSIYIYFIALALTIFTIFVIYRLENSRVGRALQAMREDEIASRAVGIDIPKNKLIAFALGATWAGFGGVLFAAKTTFINPASFTIWESIIILCFVVLGGMGSIFGVSVAAIIMIILPESLRVFADYRMITYGAVLVLMMVFRPGGIIDIKKKTYEYKKSSSAGEEA
jgi:branched-chain amino acid transport system permease protein